MPRELSPPQQRRLAQRQDEAAHHKQVMEKQTLLFGKQNAALRRWANPMTAQAAVGGIDYARRPAQSTTPARPHDTEQHAEQPVCAESAAEGTGTGTGAGETSVI